MLSKCYESDQNRICLSSVCTKSPLLTSVKCWCWSHRQDAARGHKNTQNTPVSKCWGVCDVFVYLKSKCFMVGWSNLIASLPHTSQLNIKLGQVSEDQMIEVQFSPGLETKFYSLLPATGCTAAYYEWITRGWDSDIIVISKEIILIFVRRGLKWTNIPPGSAWLLSLRENWQMFDIIAVWGFITGG